jgi:hypothetical protein
MNDAAHLDVLLKGIGPSANHDRRTRDSIRRCEAPDFRALSFFPRGEVVETEIVAYLLNPGATHGQHDVFLKIFLEVLSLEIAGRDLESVVVQTNSPCFTSPRRREILSTDGSEGILDKEVYSYRLMDILIKVKADGKDYVIAIESKSRNANDQPDQMKHYFQHVCTAYPTIRKYLIYLKDGSTPKSIDESVWISQVDGERICYSYNFDEVMSNWLRLCRLKCEAPRIAFFLQDFEAFLNTEELDMQTVNGQTKSRIEEIISIASNNGEGTDSNFEAMLSIYDMHEDMWKLGLSHCMGHTKELLDKLLPGWIVNILTYESHGRVYLDTKVYRPMWGDSNPKLWIGVETDDWIQNKEAGNRGPTFLYLCVRKAPDFTPSSALKFDQERHLLDLGPRKNVLTRPISFSEFRDLRSGDGLRALVAGSAANHIATEVVRLAGQLQPAIDSCFAPE